MNLSEAYQSVYSSQEVNEAVKGQDSEMRKAAAAERAAERKAGSKAQSPGREGPSAGKSYADYQKISIDKHDKVTKKNKNVVGLVAKEEVENVEELYKGKHGQSDKEYADSRSQGGKMVSGDSKMSGAEYTHGRRVKAANPGMQPDVGGKTKPKSQGKMDAGTRADLQYRKANLKKEGIERVDEADSLAAMQARREKRLAAQRKREGTTATGRDFGHDYSLTADQQKKRREAEFKAGIGTKKEELEASGLFTAEEIDAILEADVQFEGMHRDAKTGEVVDKAEIGKTYYPNMPKKKTSVALRKEKESQKK